MIFSLAANLAPQAARASQPTGDVIFNYPYAPVPATSPTSPKDIDWNHSADHVGYDQAYTQALSQQYNGAATPNHVVLSDDPVTAGTVAFYGYGERPYRDYVFSSTSPRASQGLSFVMRPAYMNFHTLAETGYLFNGQISKEGGAAYYTGYALILSSANGAGTQESGTGAAALRVCYLDRELWNAENFRPGATADTRSPIATIKAGINNLDSTPYRVGVEIDPETRAFKVYVDGDLCAGVSAAQVRGGPAGPTGFGFYTGYYDHNCDILTRIRYEKISILAAPGPEDMLPPASCQVRFSEKYTNREIRVPEAETSSVGQKGCNGYVCQSFRAL